MSKLFGETDETINHILNKRSILITISMLRLLSTKQRREDQL